VANSLASGNFAKRDWEAAT